MTCSEILLPECPHRQVLASQQNNKGPIAEVLPHSQAHVTVAAHAWQLHSEAFGARQKLMQLDQRAYLACAGHGVGTQRRVVPGAQPAEGVPSDHHICRRVRHLWSQHNEPVSSRARNLSDGIGGAAQAVWLGLRPQHVLCMPCTTRRAPASAMCSYSTIAADGCGWAR